MNEIQIVHILQFQRTSELKSNILQSIIPKDSKRLQMDAFKGADSLTKHFTLYSAIKKACRQNPLPTEPSPLPLQTMPTPTSHGHSLKIPLAKIQSRIDYYYYRASLPCSAISISRLPKAALSIFFTQKSVLPLEFLWKTKNYSNCSIQIYRLDLHKFMPFLFTVFTAESF